MGVFVCLLQILASLLSNKQKFRFNIVRLAEPVAVGSQTFLTLILLFGPMRSEGITNLALIYRDDLIMPIPRFFNMVILFCADSQCALHTLPSIAYSGSI